MSITYTGTGGLFTRAGAIGGEFDRVTATFGSPLTTGLATITAQFASADQTAIDGLSTFVANFATTAPASYQAVLTADGQAAILDQVNDSYPVVPYTFAQALSLLAAHMVLDTTYVARPTLGDTVTASVFGTNYSDATIVVSFINQYGDPTDMAIAETISATCTQPSPPYQETLTLVGQAALPGTNPGWPGGSGCNASLSLTDPNNCMTVDGAINNWSGTGSNTPNSWTIVNGAAGVTITRGSSPPLSRNNTISFNAQIVSDGVSLTSLQQTMNVQPNVVYAVSLWAKNSASDAAGVFSISLVDENGTIIQNSEGANQTTTVTIGRSSNVSSGTNIGATYHIYTVFFQTPRQLPISTGLRFGITTATTGTPTISVGMVGMVAVTTAGQNPGGIYPGGPYVVAWAGNKTTALNDNWSIAVTNSLTASTSFALNFDRLYGLRNLGLYLPSYPGSGTLLSDASLITH